MNNTNHPHIKDGTEIIAKSAIQYSLDDLIEECRAMVARNCTFKVALEEKHVINFINTHLPDGNTINGDVNGLTNGKIVVEITEHQGPLAQKYAQNHTLIGDSIWLTKFGCEAVDDVSMVNGRIHATLFSELRMRQEIVSWVRKHDHDDYIELLSNDDPDYINGFYEYFLEHCDEPIGDSMPTTNNKKTQPKQNKRTKYSIE